MTRDEMAVTWKGSSRSMVHLRLGEGYLVGWLGWLVWQGGAGAWGGASSQPEGDGWSSASHPQGWHPTRGRRRRPRGRQAGTQAEQARRQPA